MVGLHPGQGWWVCIQDTDGGSWWVGSFVARAANRSRVTPDTRNNYFGFRLSRTAPWGGAPRWHPFAPEMLS